MDNENKDYRELSIQKVQIRQNHCFKFLMTGFVIFRKVIQNDKNYEVSTEIGCLLFVNSCPELFLNDTRYIHEYNNRTVYFPP